MSIARGALDLGRTLAEALMSDIVRIWRETPTGTGIDANGNPAVTVTELYSGPGRLVVRSGVVRDVDAQSQLLAVQSPRLDVPVAGTGGVKNGDLFEVTASDTDSSLVGLSGVVAGMFPQSYSTARRLPVEVVS